MATGSGILACIRNDKRGNVAITFGLVVVPAVMFVGGAIDFGNAYKMKQKIQAAADAGVLAAANMPNGTTNQARQARALNIFNANVTGMPGITPTATASGNSISIVATGSINTAFLKIAHIDTISVGGASSGSVSYNSSTTTTTTTGTAAGKICLLALDPNATNGLKSQGTPNIKYIDCWAHTNSTSAASNNPNEGALVGGGSAIVEGAGHSAVGGIGNNAAGVYTPTPVGGRAAVADPFATVSAYTLPYTSYTPTFTPPTIGNTCTASNLSLKKGSFALSPGRYCGGIDIKAGATVTFAAGEYIIDNGLFNVQSGASISGTDVLFYFSGANARFTVIGGGTVNLKGRTSGPSALKGFLFIAHPNAWRGLTSNVQGGGTFNMEGMIYTPTQNILITGNGDANGSSNFMAMVAKSFEFQGNGIYRFQKWDSASNMPDIMPTMPVTTTTTTTTTASTVGKVKLD